MPEFKKLFEEVLRQKSDVDEETLSTLIQEKKKRVGAGYLTDQGALFLVAADLGVSLEEVTTASLTLKDLYIGANEITVSARILALYPIKKYRKRDGSEGEYRRAVLFDGDTSARLTLWDDNTRRIDELGTRPGSAVRIIKGYVKSGLDGSPVLNIGARGSIERLPDSEALGKLPAMADVSRDVSSVDSPASFLSVAGVLRSPPRMSQFVRNDGTQGTVIQLYLAGLENSRETRAVLWGNESKEILELPPNSVVRLVNIRSKVLPHGEIELHGDESTFAEVVSVQPPTRAAEVRAAFERFMLVSVGVPFVERDDSKSVTALMVDDERNLYTLIVRDDAYQLLAEGKLSQVVECKMEGPLRTVVVCRSHSDIRTSERDGESFPSFSEFATKINEVKEGPKPVFIEVIALTKSTVQDIVTRDGSTVRRAELVVGDETGEIKIVGWRNFAQVLEGINPGQRLRVRGLVAASDRAGLSLQVKSFSSLERVS